MPILNVEIKAKSQNQDDIRDVLKICKAKFIGIDHQIDTYFNATYGRLKLREGNIENNLIHYMRENIAGPKPSKILLYHANPVSTLKQILTAAHGVLTVVDKQREIYFIDNVKFHLDNVQTLGTFVEIEAIDKDEIIGISKLRDQCNHYRQLFSILPSEEISVGYSDLQLDLSKGLKKEESK